MSRKFRSTPTRFLSIIALTAGGATARIVGVSSGGQRVKPPRSARGFIAEQKDQSGVGLNVLNIPWFEVVRCADSLHVHRCFLHIGGEHQPSGIHRKHAASGRQCFRDGRGCWVSRSPDVGGHRQRLPHSYMPERCLAVSGTQHTQTVAADYLPITGPSAFSSGNLVAASSGSGDFVLIAGTNGAFTALGV